MDYKLFSLDRDLLSPLAKQLQLRKATDVIPQEAVQAQEAVFRLPQKNLTLGSSDLASFWHNLG